MEKQSEDSSSGSSKIITNIIKGDVPIEFTDCRVLVISDAKNCGKYLCEFVEGAKSRTATYYEKSVSVSGVTVYQWNWHQTFPGKADLFDVILGRSLICPCSQDVFNPDLPSVTTCGGLVIPKSKAKLAIDETRKVLRRVQALLRPNGAAYFTNSAVPQHRGGLQSKGRQLACEVWPMILLNSGIYYFDMHGSGKHFEGFTMYHAGGSGRPRHVLRLKGG